MSHLAQVIVLAMLFPIAVQAEENQVLDHLHRWCAQQWPDDDTMQEHCYKRQKEGLVALAPIRERVGEKIKWRGVDAVQDPEVRIFQHCARKWSPDYVMLKHCWDRLDRRRWVLETSR